MGSLLKDWRQKVLDLFQAPFSHILLVSDPDQLLDDEMILLKLFEQGFELTKFTDRASFRFEYESQYKKMDTNRNIIIVSRSDSLDELPFDIWSRAQKIFLRRSSLFPNLSSQIIHELDFRTLDLLSEVHVVGRLSSEKATMDLILRHVYGLSYDSVHSLTDCLLLITRWHKLPHEVPDLIKQYLISYLQQRTTNIPIKEWVTSKREFFGFLQLNWVHFVEREYPDAHFFWDPNIRSVLGLLFLEGDLSPVQIKTSTFPKVFSWGVVYDDKQQKLELVRRLQQQLELLLSGSIDRRTWVQIARIYGRAKSISLELQMQSEEYCLSQATENKVECEFDKWLVEHYGTLATLTDRNAPVMVHKTVEVLRLKDKDKIALVVCDGLSFVQWALVEQTLLQQFDCEVAGSYAWIPTLTSVSRQSIFSGEMPRFFNDSINTTAKEEKAWKSLWERNGIPVVNISYERSLGQGKYERHNVAALKMPKIKVAGLIVDTIDQLTHNTIQGQLGIHAALSVWLEQGYLQSLLADLIDAGYDVYLTSDHGNKESKGIGRPNDGTLPETRGERVRVYRDVVLRDQAAVQYSCRRWSGNGLPDDFHALIARSGEAFVREGEVVVSHGGTSIEEVIVPFVHIQKKYSAGAE